MTKQVATSMHITPEFLAWLKSFCDVPAKASDSDKQLRWKAAQREIYIKAKAIYDANMNRAATPSNVAENLSIKVKSED